MVPLKVEAAPAAPGVFELGRMEPFPSLGTMGIYIGGAANLRDRLREEIKLKRGELSGTQYFRFEEKTNWASRRKELLDEFKREKGKLPQVNEQREEI